MQAQTERAGIVKNKFMDEEGKQIFKIDDKKWNQNFHNLFKILIALLKESFEF